MVYIYKARHFLNILQKPSRPHAPYFTNIPKKNLIKIAEWLGKPLSDLEGCILQLEIHAIHINKQWISLSPKGELKILKEKEETNDNTNS